MEISFSSDTNYDKVITRYSAHVKKIVLLWKVQMLVIISHPSKELNSDCISNVNDMLFTYIYIYTYILSFQSDQNEILHIPRQIGMSKISLWSGL